MRVHDQQFARTFRVDDPAECARKHEARARFNDRLLTKPGQILGAKILLGAKIHAK
jgi:hypothetical protein